jgi:hypothetical protein
MSYMKSRILANKAETDEGTVTLGLLTDLDLMDLTRSVECLQTVLADVGLETVLADVGFDEWVFEAVDDAGHPE